MNNLISNRTNFNQDFKGRYMKNKFGLFNITNQLFITEITPCAGSSYFPVSREQKNPMKGLISIKSEDNESFRWCSDT